MSKLVPPHGSASLKPLLLEGSELTQELAFAKTLPRINCSSREVGDILMLGIGGFTPLDGFMDKNDWQCVSDTMTMENGLFWLFEKKQPHKCSF
mgnify:CR=1 FL=1